MPRDLSYYHLIDNYGREDFFVKKQTKKKDSNRFWKKSFSCYFETTLNTFITCFLLRKLSNKFMKQHLTKNLRKWHNLGFRWISVKNKIFASQHHRLLFRLIPSMALIDSLPTRFFTRCKFNYEFVTKSLQFSVDLRNDRTTSIWLLCLLE